MYLYKLRIAYDGTAYHGWQVQEREVTVAGTMEQSFLSTFGIPVSLVGASRTDAGVHAYDQVALCRTELCLDPHQMRKVWGRVLPQDIAIRSLEVTDMGFHPQQDVLEKTYWYHIVQERPLPFLSRFAWWYEYPIDRVKLERALAYAVGTHDFRSFCTGDDHASTVRTINSIAVVDVARYGAMRVVVRGPSFLYRMIRRIVGGAVHIATHRSLAPELFAEVLQARNPLHTLATAPARGLLLRKIMYGRDEGEERYERSVATKSEFLEMAQGID